MTDNEIMDEVKSGNNEALGLLFERYKETIYTYVFYRVRNRFVAEDIVQNAFLKVLKYKANYIIGSNFKAWLLTVARNLVMDHFRKNKVNMEISGESIVGFQVEDKAPSAQDDLEIREKRQLLHRALSHLDEEKREILVLVKLNEMKYKEVANILGTSEGNLRIKVFRSMKELQLIVQKLNSESVK